MELCDYYIFATNLILEKKKIKNKTLKKKLLRRLYLVNDVETKASESNIYLTGCQLEG